MIGGLSLTPFRDTPYTAQFVFAGAMFKWQYQQSFPNGNTNFQLKTSTGKIVHLIARNLQTASTGLSFIFNENGIKADGILATGITNVNRINDTAVTAAINTAPTTSTGGATAPINLETIKLVANTASVQLAPEIILKTNTSYLMTIANSGGATPADFTFVWYESSN